jgi:hypothetical protein
VPNSLSQLCPPALLPPLLGGFFHSHVGLNQIQGNKTLTLSLREKNQKPPFLHSRNSNSPSFYCIYVQASFAVFSGRNEPSVSQLTKWDKYCGRLSSRKGKYKWFVTLINIKHRNRNAIWNGIQRGSSLSKFNSGGWKTMIEFPSQWGHSSQCGVGKRKGVS